MNGSGKGGSKKHSQVNDSASGKQSGGLFPLAGDLPGERDLFRGVVASLHETIILGIDRAGRYLFAWGDPELAKLYGMDFSELSGKSLNDYFPEPDAPRRVKEINQVFDEGKFFREEYPLDLPGGRFWHDATISPLRDESGKVIAALGIIQDITRSKRAEHRLEESEKRYCSVVEQSNDYIVIHRDGEILFTNQATSRALGADGPEQVVGRSIMELVHPDSRELVRRRLELVHRIKEQAGDTPEILPPIEEKFIGREGKVIIGEAISQRVVMDDKPVVLTTVRDITERRQAEQELSALDERIRNAQKQESLAILAGGLAHDFNNLLMGVLGNASIVLSEMNTDSAWYDRLLAIEKAAVRAAELTRKLLAYSGGGKFMLQPVDLAGLCREMADLLRTSISGKIDFSFESDPNLPLVSADATQLRQVVMNLFLNAAEAIGDREGKIDVRIRALEADAELLSSTFMLGDLEEGPCIGLVVADDGCGMDPATRTKMFDPFYSTKGSGRGLGLAAVLGIVRGHGGTLRVASQEGGGTRFELFLPVASAAEIEQAVPRRQLAGRRPADWRPQGLLLLADDEQHVREVMGEALSSTGIELMLAVDGREAVDLFEQRSGQFKAAILDMTMPRLSGSEVLEKLRQLRPDLPVVLTSGYSNISSSSGDVGGPPSIFLAKPFRPAELLDALYEVLS